ncbi:glycerophosphodiester phosphodiesterase family protein [Candidatus Protochlamydia naegleriophila]|nr:glycerophosphodiester phosphodiesterase family protein [Candidatus Protochlamydia naegleriophila]
MNHLAKVLMMLLPSLSQAFEIQGHRGARGLLPENTLPSFSAAVEAGVHGIEVDLLMTKDGEIVIHHDFFLNPRLCQYRDGSPIQNIALIKESTLSELKELDCGCRLHPKFPKQHLIPGTPIPTLQELLNALSSESHPNAKMIRLNLEIKADPATPHYIPEPALIVKKIADIVCEKGFANRVYYSSFDLALLAEMRRRDIDCILGLILDEESLIAQGIDPLDWLPTVISIAHSMQATIISPHYDLMTKEVVERLHQAGLRAIPWTINQQSICQHLIEMGADGVITDYPIDMLAFVNRS